MTSTKKILMLAVVALTVAAAAPVAAFADDPVGAVQADIAKLKTDVQAKHDQVVADAQKLETDANSFAGTSDKKTARQTIRVDALKLTGDWRSLLSTCLADRVQLRADVLAAKQAGVPAQQLRLLVRQANLEIRLTNLNMREAVAEAHLAVVKLRESFAASGQQAPNVTTPPSTTPTPAPVTP